MALNTEIDYAPDVLDLDGNHSDWLAIGIFSDLEVMAGDLRPTATRDDLRAISSWLDRAMDSYDKFNNGLLKAVGDRVVDLN